jgi:hypothetical protein
MVGYDCVTYLQRDWLKPLTNWRKLLFIRDDLYFVTGFQFNRVVSQDRRSVAAWSNTYCFMC